ncbi:MAG TPA: magnesium chelatase [Lachnospiraceae bacterium]|nr:magnesium chelatase [Lachnospiraceae bacterium]
MNRNIQVLKDNIYKGFVGREEVVENVITVLLSGGHILIEDVPGVGKTTLAKLIARSVDVSLARIQFTPDTLPSDITGVSVFDDATSDFRVIKGPIHNNIVIADEINRASPKTQSALLEAMEEKQVTIDGKSFVLEEPFMVIATENPAEQIGTYPLPEAEMDRFMMKISIGYPDMDNQMILARKYLDGILDEEVTPVLSSSDIMNMREEVKSVIMTDEVIKYALSIVDRTRIMSELEYGLSPRAGLDLLIAGKAHAYIAGRDYVIPEDIIDMSKVVLPHRMVLTTQSLMNRYTADQLINEVLEKTVRPK